MSTGKPDHCLKCDAVLTDHRRAIVEPNLCTKCWRELSERTWRDLKDENYFDWFRDEGYRE